jgi:methylmalonyl-CoA mutase
MADRIEPYHPKNHVRIVTAASLFDGHDAAINIMRRILQATGAEVVHLGHNRSVADIVDCAIQEDAQGIAITSYQGGHVEFFKYMRELLDQRGANQIRIFGGGGGTILPAEIKELHDFGIDRIFSPDDGREMGLQGMINEVMRACDFETKKPPVSDEVESLATDAHMQIAQLITVAENHPDSNVAEELAEKVSGRLTPVLGITGTGGAGKSSLVDELVRRFLDDFSGKTVAVISVDPSKRKSGGALLGDRIRMNSISSPRVYMRSLATRQANLALSKHVGEAVAVCKAAGFDLIIVETSGIGQSDTEITEHSDVALYVMTSEYGAATQLEKIDMLDFADVIAINKFDKRGSLDALRDVRKQYKRNHQLFEADDDSLPIFGTVASQFGDPGVSDLYRKLMALLVEKTNAPLSSNLDGVSGAREKLLVIPPDRTRYLAEIAESSDAYDKWVASQSAAARTLYQACGAVCAMRGSTVKELVELFNRVAEKLHPDVRAALRS